MKLTHANADSNDDQSCEHATHFNNMFIALIPLQRDGSHPHQSHDGRHRHRRRRLRARLDRLRLLHCPHARPGARSRARGAPGALLLRLKGLHEPAEEVVRDEARSSPGGARQEARLDRRLVVGDAVQRHHRVPQQRSGKRAQVLGW